MKLFLTKGWTGTDRLIKNKPKEGDLSKLLHSLDWKDFNAVRLEQDPSNWIVVSGNQGKDGLSIVAEEDGLVSVSFEAPESINQLDEALKLYLKKDPSLKDKWFRDDSKSSKPPGSNPNYDTWKSKFIEKQKAKKKNLIYATLGAFIIIGSISIFLYLFFNEELKFIGHDTTELTAIVTKTETVTAYRSLRQSVQYSFNYRNQPFVGYFISGIADTRYNEGDKLIIKIAKDDPRISKKVARLKRTFNIIY